MNLYLVQHADAVSESVNPERPLSQAGWAAVRRIATFAASQGHIKPQCIIHSGKLRAQQTADVLAQHLKPPQGLAEAEGLAPMADPSIWIDRLTKETDDMMLVGHLPHLSKLCSQLLCGDSTNELVRFQNAGIACLGKNKSGNWSLQWKVNPDLVSALLS